MSEETMAGDLVAAVEQHTALYNECVHSGDWLPFVATYTEDAEMRFANRAFGPVVGRAAIGNLITGRPPTRTMTLTAVEPLGPDTVRVAFVQGDRPGEMVVRWRAGLVAAVEHR